METIPVTCFLPDGALFDVLTNDVSLDGLTFYTLDSPHLPVVGDSLKLTFANAELKDITPTCIIRSVSRVLDMACFKAEFTELPGEGRLKLTDYLSLSERQVAQEAPIGNEKKHLVFIIDEARSRDHYAALDQRFNVTHSDSFDVIGKLSERLPDAILFNSALSGAEMVLQILRKHPKLKGTPVIELQGEKRKIPGNFFKSLPLPLDENLVLDTLNRAINLRDLSTMLHDGEFVGPFKTGINILLVDDTQASKADDVEHLRSLDCDVKLIDDLKSLYDSFVWSTPDVIAIDENTKEIDAITVCRLLNLNRELKDVPKVLLSEKRRRLDPVKTNLFSSVLIKPLSAKQLLSKFHSLLPRTSD